MPSVTVRSGQLVDPLLTDIARQYRPHGFIADRVMPRVTVQKESGKYTLFTTDDFHRTDVNLLKPDRAKTKEVDFGVSSGSYVAEEYAVKSSISRRERENADDPIKLEQSKLALAMDQLLLAHEVRVALALRKVTTGQITSGAAPSNNWNVDAGTIEADLVTAKEAVYDLIGYEPNTLVLPYKVANAIAVQQDIREILKYTVPGQQVLSEGQGILPAKLWGLNVLIPVVRGASNAEGAAAAYTDVWGDDPRVLYVSPNASWGTPSVGYTFQTRGVEVRRWQEDDPNVEYIEVSEVCDEAIVAPDAGYEVQDVLS